MSKHDQHGHDHSHDHEHPHDHGSELSELDLRVKALESLLTEKGYINAGALEALIQTYEYNVGPRNGARVIAKAWAEPSYREWLLKDATAAIASLGYTGRQGEHITAVANTPERHNMIVCTLCSCYPWPVLGLPPMWYKSAPYRSRAVIDPKGVLLEFGVELPDHVELSVWDSTSEMRYLVVPMQPDGTQDWSQEKLAELVTRDSMIGTGLALHPHQTGAGVA
jgi:nitrile hydratase